MMSLPDSFWEIQFNLLAICKSRFCETGLASLLIDKLRRRTFTEFTLDHGLAADPDDACQLLFLSESNFANRKNQVDQGLRETLAKLGDQGHGVSLLEVQSSEAPAGLGEVLYALLTIPGLFLQGWKRPQIRAFGRMRLLKGLVGLLPVLVSRKRFRKCLGKVKAPLLVLTAHERWFPNSTAIRTLKGRGISIHYPHGFVGEELLPFASDHILFWNSRMEETVTRETGCRGTLVGLVGKQQSLPRPDVHTMRVLLSSQYHGYRLGLTDHPELLREIFFLWREVLTTVPGLQLWIKPHPNDSEEDQGGMRKIFSGLESRVTMLPSAQPIREALSRCTVHSTVSSGSIVDATRMGLTSILLKGSTLVERNFPDDGFLVRVSSSGEVCRYLAKMEDGAKPVPDWTDSEAASRRILDTILEQANVAKGKLSA